VLVTGTNDLAKNCMPSTSRRRPLLPARPGPARRQGRGKAIVDGVYNDVKDLAGFEAECVQDGSSASTARR